MTIGYSSQNGAKLALYSHQQRPQHSAGAFFSERRCLTEILLVNDRSSGAVPVDAVVLPLAQPTLLTTWTYIVLRFGFAVSRELLIPVLAVFCVIFPVVFFRDARSLWLSFDCYFDKTGALKSISEIENSPDEKL